MPRDKGCRRNEIRRSGIRLVADLSPMRALQLLRAGACAVVLLLPGVASALPDGRGFPLIEVVEPAVPDLDPQSFGVTHDPRGLVYVAGGSGILIHDGAGWRH